MLLFAVIVGMTQTAWGQTGNWTDYKASGYASGSGTVADPYVIKTAEQLAYFSAQVTSGKDKSVYVNLGADIDLIRHYWMPIGNLDTNSGNNFSGTFDGNGHVIKNMTVAWEAKSGGKKAYALFSSLLSGAKVRNLVIDNAYLYNTDTDTPIAGEDRLVAVFAGIIKSPTTIENIIIRKSKVEAAKAFKQNGKWIIYGGFAAKVADNNDNYILSNIYVDADIDFTKMTVNKSDAVYSALFIPEFFGNVKKAPQNIYLCGSIKSAANISKVGPVFGTNLPSSSTYGSTWQLNSANTFQYITDGTTYTDLTTKNAGGTSVSEFDNSTFNTYASDNDLLAWTGDASNPALKKIAFPTFTKTRDESVPNSRDFECKVTMEGENPDDYSYEWTLDGVKQESATTNTLTITSTNKVINGKVKITNNSGYDYTCNFTIDPLYYSIDLYADEFGGGDGTASKPYIINDDMQLAKLARDVNNGKNYSRTYFKLGADITLDKALWMPIGTNNYDSADKYFYGKFDGDGHIVNDMTIEWYSDATWGAWGLFAVIQGKSTDEAGFASVTNLIIDGAELYKKANYTPSTTVRGIDLGTLVGEALNNTEISNVIVRNSKITDNDDVYGYPTEDFYIGGVVGAMGHWQGGSIVRVYNISSDTEIKVAKNHTVNRNTFCFGGIVGKCAVMAQTNSLHIYPTNLYYHGTGIQTNRDKQYVTADIVGIFSKATPTDAQKATWYYNASVTDFKQTWGNALAFTDDNAKQFQSKANTYITDNSLSDKLLWAYDNVNHYTFGSIELTGVENKNYTITAPAGTYTWYLSSDRTNWKAITTGVSEGTNVVEIPYQEYMQYVYATDGNSISKVITVRALRINDILLNHVEGTKDYSVSVTNSLWENNDNLTITYAWYDNYISTNKNNTVLGTGASYTYTGSETSPKISCNIIVEYNGTEIANEWVGGERVIYLCPAGVTIGDKEYNAGSDEKDGLSPENAKLTWQGAYAALHDEGSWDENIIVLMGTSSSEATFNTSDSYKGFGILGNLTKNDRSGSYSDWKQAVEASNLNRNATITGKYGSVDYKGIIEMKGAAGQINGEQGGLGIFGDTRFENITFMHKSGQYDIFYCQYNSLEMGEGVVMKNYPNGPGYGTLDGATTMSFQVFGGINNDNRFSPLNTAELIKAMEDAMPHGREGFTMTFKSGHYSTICAGGRQNQDGLNGVMGTANMPVKCTITMDIDRKWNDEHNDLKAHYDAGIIMAGNHEGAMFGDVDIIIKRGKIGRLVNGTLGAYRETNNKINAPFNTYMGRASITLDPRKDENGSPIHSDIVVTELYGGSCGRGFTGSQVIENPFYGHAKVTINGGTFKYLGSGDGGKLQKGIFGAGAGGMNGIGDGKTTDQRIGYWEGKVMKFGTYETAKSNLLTYNCYNADTHTYTVISPLDTKTEMVINGGEFGTSASPIDGVYAGGSGYMAPGLWTNAPKAIPSPQGGNIYGRKGQTVVSLTINGGTFYCTEGVFAGGRGTDYYYKGNKYGATDASVYDKLGQIYGNVEMNIKGGEFHCPVFGGGYGVADAELKVTTTDESGNSTTTTTFNTLSDMALITGRSIVRINGGTFYGNVYGGGDMARIDAGADKDATYLEISSSADIRGSVFAGGRGREKNTGTDYDSKKTQKPELVGKVTGNTDVSFYGSVQKAPYIYGDIYGGGALAVVDGNTNVNLYAGNFAGEIFGGGQGLLKEDGTVLNSADVLGNTSVLLAQDQGGQEEGEDGKLEDQFSINVIWNKLWKSTGFVTWDEKKDLFYKEGKFINPHNIYGGGQNACVVGTYEKVSEDKNTLKEGTGTATVNVLKGMTPIDLLRTQEWKESYTDNKNPHFYVFGGGYGKNTKVGNTDVTVNVEGDYGIYNAETDDSDEQLAKPRAWQGAGLSSAQEAESLKVEEGQVFDNSKGIPNFTVLGVLGGGYAGTVAGDTRVEVDGKTFLHRVYGGGFGDPYASSADDKTGQVGGNTEVYVKGANIYGDVFGGGAGVASKIETDPKIDFTDVARVTGKTMVEVSDDARIFGNVYGGGDIANVGAKVYTHNYSSFPQSTTELNQTDGSFNKHEASDYQAYVNILGGDIFGEVYAGGKGLKRGAAKDYTSLGRINGNTLLHVANTESDVATIAFDENDNNIPHIWSRIYGGCAYGTVDGNTLVHIEGGMLGNNIFGGGYGYLPVTGAETEYEMFNQVLGRKDTGKEATYANVLGNTKVQMDGGSWIWNKCADIDGNITVWDDANRQIVADESGVKPLVAELKAASAKGTEALKALLNSKGVSINPAFFDIENRIFIKSHNIFGGGNQACLVGSYTTEGSYLSDPTASLAENTGKAMVELNHSPLTALTSYDNGDVQTYSLLDPTTLAGVCWYLSINETEHPQFSVFGAGFGVNTKVGSTEVLAQPGAFLDKDGNEMTVSGTTIRYRNQRADMEVYRNFNDAIYSDYNDPKKVSTEDKIRYYGSADGTGNDPKTFLRYRSSRLAWTYGVSGFTFKNIHGGGYSGYVCGGTKVVADNQLACRNIFGGGIGAQPYTASETLAEESLTNKYDFGSVKNTCVYIKSGIVSQDVFGGGVGITSNKNGETYTDFPDMARVQSGTQVHVYGEKIDVDNKEMDRTVIFGSVFGGGDAANVGTYRSEAAAAVLAETGGTYATNLNIRGGAIFSYIFAGGKGRLKSECADYTKLGGIYGNTRVIVDYPHDVMAYPYLKKDGTAYDPAEYMAGASVESTPHATPEIFNRIYGGCQNGTVYGNTLVDIENGNIGYNIFGGGWGNILDDENVAEDKRITSADVKGNTNIFINGGNALLTSYWLPDARNWEPASVKGTKVYSPQYDPEARKFKINHNIYGGGNLACEVTNTYITMAKGMLKDDTRVVGNDATPFFSTDEWKDIYNKVGSPHFSVFGGGYGENTNVTGNTQIDVKMEANKSIESKPTITAGEEYKHFVSGYSVMDVVGGGYSGKVSGNTQVNISGIFCRRIFGGGFYNTVQNTKIDIDMVDSRDIFGGGLMGDVLKSTTINVGKNTEETNNKDIYIHGSIYGANDVSGYVNIVLNENGEFKDKGGTGTNINIYGGHIDGNVYGAGNGDYLYALDRKGNTQVTVNEHYLLNPDDPSSEEFDLVYTVPMRETMPSYKSASDAAKIVNINSWRPLTNKVNIKIAGKGADDKVEIKGDVYGGGNSATVLKVNPSSGEGTELQGSVTLDIGSHVNIGRVFMGCNGDALFTASEDNAFMTNFRRLNGDLTKVNGDLDLGKSIDWITDPSNKAISTLYLPTKNDERPLIYPHLLDLYFQPVEMDIQGTVLWNGKADGTGLENCTIGTFCCGGNRGNMNIYPNSDGQVFQYTFPAGLTITDKIVGGCNNANYEWKSGDSRVYHEGGYLLGLAKSKEPFIELNVNCKFEPTEADGAYTGGNVYGGCYETGTIRGDITINLKSDMLYGKDKSKLDESNKLLSSNPKYSALNVYGAGYGMESYVYGNPNVKVAEGEICKAPVTNKYGKFDPSGTSANFVYGGGQQGNVIGVTNVEVFNGHIYKSVTGGSYSGYVWGSTHVKVGYPKYYEVLFGKTGKYVLKRTDQENKDITDETTGSTSVKQYVYLVTGDMITEGVYNDIVAIDNGTYVEISDKKSYFKEKTTDVPSSLGWNNINIKIGEAVYGGGYSLAHGASVMANNTTVLKFTDKYNLDVAFTTNDEHKAELAALPGSSTKGFGGNTTILVADRVVMPASPGDKDNDDRDHITISHQEMKAVTDVASGTDLQGYYYKDKDGNYRYIYMAGRYYMGIDGKMDSKTTPSDIYVDGTTKDLTVYEYDNEGGIFGDGHLSYAEGFRSADLTGYGFASSSVSSPKILNTFQRMDILRLTDNCFTLLGARDYATNSTDKTPYSVSRVGEIQMVAENIKFNVVGENKKLYVGSGNELKTKRARNYMGFANNIRYVGAVNSDVAFTDPMYDGKGELQTETTYMGYKQDIIDGYFTSTNGNYGKNQIFEKRNNGTAKNMIGIASGYALKIQNLQETVNKKGEIIDKPFYGPIYGVIEMNLIDVREDEGGGYVYADNIHKRAASDKHSPDFLETTGNFVFPELPNEARFIVDDCFPTGYQMPTTSTGTAGAKQFMSGAKTTEEASTGTSDVTNNQEIHYWYVTGYNYYYNAHITGYTSKQKNKFLSANDAVMVLSGIKPGQEINIIGNTKLVTDDDSDDLSSRNYKEGEKDKSGTSVKGKYNLYISAPADLLGKDIEKIGSDETSEFKEGFFASLDMDGKGGNKKKISKLSATDKSYPQIRFMLTDEVDNSSSEYYNQHLSRPYKAKIILTAPAMQYEIDDKGQYTGNLKPVTDYLSLKGQVYTKNEDNTYSSVSDAIPLAKNTTYYYRTGDFDLYQKITNLYTKTTTDGKVTWNKVEFGTEGAMPATLYSNVERNYTYTIDLTIEYVQGPDINGNITIDNCALPGEMIRLKKDKVTIDADESFAANGYYWRIGKDFNASDTWTVDGTATNYSIYKVGDEKGTGLFAGCYYNTTEDYLEVPAYYFMNGYKVQLGISMNQLDGIFSAEMLDTDHLVVHNYHQMDPHATGVDLHLAEAVARANSEDTFAEPRIYLSDQQDLRAFTQFIDTIGAADHSTTVKIGGEDKTVPQYGEKVQFVFQNNITAPEDYAAPKVFKGIIHGNGNVLSGLAQGKYFINDNQGQIYNLGLASGQIASGNTNGGTFHCCFEYRPSSGKPVVYRLNGTKDDKYTDEDFRYGKVAYDLNQYYLEARNTLAENAKTLADNTNLQYVKEYFANGDYQYAFRKDELTGNTTGIKYLRTGSGTAIYPNYGNYETRHDKTHAIDCPRAHGYVAAHEATQDDVTAGKVSSVGEMVPESRTGNYEPLFNAEKHSDASNVTNTEVMNDYLFWGQSLQSMPDDYPSRIHSNQVSNMTNRVYRAAGYYRDTKLSTFHYNAFKRDATMMSTYVYLPATTAIDFTCHNDLPAAVGYTGSSIYYPPVNDVATKYHNLVVKPESGVSRNLLVYTSADDKGATTDAYDAVYPLNYKEETPETNIQLHHIVQGSAGFSTLYLHLVERAVESEDNNDFCAPIPFTVTDRAWYTRKPKYYSEAANDAWEGICLPFTVNKAEASVNGEITHFYGTAPAETAPAENHWNLHHEYWLRGMTEVSKAGDKATFKRPGTGLFTGGGTEGDNYTFFNDFFVQTYGSQSYNSDVNTYYAQEHIWDDYLPLTANVPYIMSLPGKRYYEFDLTSEFYNRTNPAQPAQTVTFNAYGEQGTITISKTGDMKTNVSSYDHTGTFIAENTETTKVYGINATGTAFDDAPATILPFRTYIRKTASGAKPYSPAVSVISIAETRGIDTITPEGGEQADVQPDGNYILVAPAGRGRISVESTFATTLKVFTPSGQLYRILDVRSGTATYSGFQPGLYIVGKVKVRVM